MTKPLKVFSIDDGTTTSAVACATKTEAIKLLGTTTSTFRTYGSVWRPDSYDGVFVGRPGVVFRRKINYVKPDDPWTPVEPSGQLPRWAVVGLVSASKYLGVYEAATPEEAIERAINEAGHVLICHQCCGQCEDPEIHEATADPVGPDVPLEVAE